MRISPGPFASELAVVVNALVSGFVIERLFDPAAVSDELIDDSLRRVLTGGSSSG